MVALTRYNPIADMLARQRAVVLDGALASELERRGCNLNDALWSAKVLLEAPELIYQVHADYLAAGADIITSASYQVTFEGFERNGIPAAEAGRLMRRSVELACQARDDFWAKPANRVGRVRPLVAASVGPYGAMLADGSEYRGGYGLSEQQLMDFHRPRLQALIAAEPDLLACETLPSMLEARALARLLAEFSTTPAWISFSCCDKAHISEGDRFADCVVELSRYEWVVALGINCSAPENSVPLLRDASGWAPQPLLVYPNSGETYDAEHKCWQGVRDAQPFSEAARQWYDAGARLIGGCCRTTPEDIRALAAWVRS